MSRKLNHAYTASVDNLAVSTAYKPRNSKSIGSKVAFQKKNPCHIKTQTDKIEETSSCFNTPRIDYPEISLDSKQEEDFKKFLKEFNSNKFHRLRSWETCYKFFSSPDFSIKDSEKLNQAGVQLGFYLASFGMFRANTRLMEIGDAGYRQLVQDIFSEIEDPSGHTGKTIPINLLVKAVSKALAKVPFKEASHSEVLVSKIILGMFCRSIAFDTNVKKGIREFKKNQQSIREISAIGCTLSSLPAWENLITNPSIQKIFKQLTPKFYSNNETYPLMRTLDMYLWFIGKSVKRQV